MEHQQLSDDVRTFVGRCAKMVTSLAEVPMIYYDPTTGRKIGDQKLADAEAARCAALAVVSAADSVLGRIDLRNRWTRPQE